MGTTLDVLYSTNIKGSETNMTKYNSSQEALLA